MVIDSIIVFVLELTFCLTNTISSNDPDFQRVFEQWYQAIFVSGTLYLMSWNRSCTAVLL